jgi:iron(III) transport system ATP-binding protein
VTPPPDPNAVVATGLLLQRPAFRLGPIDLAVPCGGRLAVVGPSGSGKTTLLRCLAGFDRPGAGAIAIDGRTVFDGAHDLPPDRRRVGFVFQDGALWPHLTALQHLTFAAPGLDRAAARDLLAQAGLAHLERRKPNAMSGGEAQRLGLVRALAGAPSVLLLDEPLRSVDVHLRDELALLVRRFADERRLATILVTHDRDEALALATDLVVLRDGHVVERGPAAELLQRPGTAFTAAFLAGAACLRTTPAAGGGVATPFGDLPAPAGDRHSLRLVLLPGEVAADAVGPATAPRGRVLACLPGEPGFVARVALHDQIVHARARVPLPVGSEAALTLLSAPRLLPWQANGSPA